MFDVILVTYFKNENVKYYCNIVISANDVEINVKLNYTYYILWVFYLIFPVNHKLRLNSVRLNFFIIPVLIQMLTNEKYNIGHYR